MTPRKRALPCECTDPGCPQHPGKRSCPNHGITPVYRVDMEDETGTLMCEGCASDALESGVFTVTEEE